ncbi:MAG: site-specific integrase [Planctomycetes bacterium]|nr:site-specific integrase [Planctomycetota bacterium]
MAVIQERNDSFRVLFCYLGKRHSLTLGKVAKAEADAFAGNVDLLLMRIKQRLVQIPTGVDIGDFLLHGGNVPEAVVAVSERVVFSGFKERYLQVQQNGGMEANSLATVTMHLGHVERTLGKGFPLQELTLADLQRHVTTRSQKKYRGKKLSPATLKREMSSFRAAWNWAAPMGLVKGSFPSKGLVFPKSDEKLPFMTWPEIERRLQVKGLSPSKIEELWACLYLRKNEIEELLEHVEETATHPWVYPFVATAAYTGARRSELLRIEIADVDFDGDMILIREKKRSRKQRTTRQVSLAPPLKKILQDWLTVHPGGHFLFCQNEVVARSKKRSTKTGYQSEDARPTTQKERLATVAVRARPGMVALTKDEAHDHFQRTLAGSKWSVLRGFHVLRHSFISCLAAEGVDQRIIDDFVGHQTDEQRKRYRHLTPNVKQKAIAGVFA